MRVLLLSPYSNRLVEAIESCGDEVVVVVDGQIDSGFCIENQIEYIVSYGYRFILGQEVLKSVAWKAINMHISVLPYARGAHPVFWSILEGRPIGATIHIISKGLDTGDILLQAILDLDLKAETFRSCYEKTSRLVEDLFVDQWKNIRVGAIRAKPQLGDGSYHRSSEVKEWEDFLPIGWDTTIETFMNLSGEY